MPRNRIPFSRRRQDSCRPGRWRLRVLSTAFLVAATASAVADEGRIPIWEPGTVITESGRFVVTRALRADPGEAAIIIEASDVDVDLNGFTLHGSDTAVIRASGVSNVAVQNGVITSGTDGLSFLNVRRAVVEDLRIADSAQNGIVLDGGTGFVVRGNQIEGAGETAIVVEGVAESGSHGLIEDNLVHQCHSGIIVRNGSGVDVRANHLHEFASGGTGVILELSRSCLIANNVVAGGAIGTGIHLDDSSGCRIEGNTVRGWSYHGIFLEHASDGNQVVDNVVYSCGACGIFVDGRRNHVEGNQLANNADFGLKFSSMYPDGNNTYGRNTARGGGGGTCSGPHTISWCDAGTGNTSFGDNLMPDLL